MTPRLRNAAVVLLISMGPANASAQNRPVTRFEDFLQQTRAAGFEMYSGRPEAVVRDAAAFEEMRQYILAMYEGVTVTHSYVLGTHHVDCIPIEQQPSVHLLGLKEITTAPAPFRVTKSHSIERATQPNSEAVPDSSVSSSGSSGVCEEHTIPMMRLTLEQLARFSDLRHFLHKSPYGHNAPADAPPDPWRHRYAFTYQKVNNLGGNSTLNYWNPPVNGEGEAFSLSQQWYVGGTGTTYPGLQTVEVGWQVYPAKYGDNNSHLFIYWTADGYKAHGCYNLECPGFVQTNPNWVLGSECLFVPPPPPQPPPKPKAIPCYLPNVSIANGTQYEFTAQFNLYNGEWWLYLGRSAGSELTAIGYYPVSIYTNPTGNLKGQLTEYAQEIEYGTESVSTSNYFPPEGSGQFPNLSCGYSCAAYQRDMFYIAPTGIGYWDTLTAAQPSPNCYQVTGPYMSNATGWGIYFYVGGPGAPKGAGC